MKVVVTGGGTGGHIYPALAVAQSLQKQDPDVALHYVGGVSGPESEIVPRTGIPFLAVKSRKLRRVLSPSTIGVLWALWQGYRQAAVFLKAFKPDVVVSTGGYVAGATALAAARQKLPLIIQACDAIPGRTNLWVGKYATRVCIWFEDTKRYFPGGRTAATGVPLREGLVSDIPQEDARTLLGLRRDLPTVLVIGGSQGARRLNELAVGMRGFLNGEVQILHQTGPRNIEEVRAAVESGGFQRIQYETRPYLEGIEVALAYRAADVVICRCGISTLAEVTANGIPSLMVPLPTAYADHQTANAREVAKAGGGRLLTELSLTSESLAKQVNELIGDFALRIQMSEASRLLGRPHAADDVGRLAISMGTGHDA